MGSSHSFAVNLLIAGGNIRDVMRHLGHMDIKTTMIYLELADTLTDSAIELMPDVDIQNVFSDDGSQ